VSRLGKEACQVILAAVRVSALHRCAPHPQTLCAWPHACGHLKAGALAEQLVQDVALALTGSASSNEWASEMP
jgi:hypothetical protein